MAKVFPFKAVRPYRDKVSLVSSRSYESYSDSELGAQLDYNPFSFLHIVNPGYKFQHNATPSERFKMVKNRYIEYKENEILFQDSHSIFYIYQQKTKDSNYCGIIAATSNDDYKQNIIKCHEETLKEREVLFGKYLKTVGFNAEPILLTYQDNSIIEDIIKNYINERPEYEFTSRDKKLHKLWLITTNNDINTISLEFEKMDALYIADGHHRSASSQLVCEQMRKKNPNCTGNEPYNFCMSYLIPESHLKISSFNRFVKSLNGLTKEKFLIELDKLFRIQNLGRQLYKPSKKHHFSMYLDGDFYSLYLRQSVYKMKNSLSELDAQLLYDTVLNPILGIKNLRDDNKISYKKGKNSEIDLKTYVDSGQFKVSFGLYPATINQLKSIANSNLKMPPKSTYIEPKLRSAITLFEF